VLTCDISLMSSPLASCWVGLLESSAPCCPYFAHFLGFKVAVWSWMHTYMLIMIEMSAAYDRKLILSALVLKPLSLPVMVPLAY
jgi:hypothetical protein